MGTKEQELADMLGTTPQSLWRWRKDEATPKTEHLRRILDLAFAADELAELYTPDEARVWLFERHRLIDGRRPVELITAGEIETVLALIAQLKDSAVA
jgi:transcriptional regulator with XRE-family HTH domain